MLSDQRHNDENVVFMYTFRVLLLTILNRGVSIHRKHLKSEAFRRIETPNLDA